MMFRRGSLALSLTLLAGCAGDYRGSVDSNTSLTAQQQEANAAKAAVGFKVPLKGDNFYSLTSPNSYACAGDLKTYYSAGAVGTTGTPAALLASSSSTGATIKPTYIKNISVDLTDTGLENEGNLARGCSYGTLSGRSVTSSCATFDSSNYQGLVTAAAGSFLVLGGITSENAGGRSTYLATGPDYRSHTVTCGSQKEELSLSRTATESGVSNCPATDYTLGVENITSGSTQLSQWKSVDLEVELPRTPVAVQVGTESQVVVTSGQMRTDSGSYAFSDSDRTWLLDLNANKSESIVNIGAAAFADSIRMIPEQATFQSSPTTAASTVDRVKDPGGLALFGYVALPNQKIGFVPNRTFAPGTMIATPHNLLGRGIVSSEEQIWIVGGTTSMSAFTGQYTTTGSTYRFDPTFSPQLKTLSSDEDFSSVYADFSTATIPIVWSWLDSSPTTPLNLRDSLRPLDDGCTTSNTTYGWCPLRAKLSGTYAPLGSSFVPVARTSTITANCNLASASGNKNAPCGTSYVLAINSLDPSEVAIPATRTKAVHQYSERSISSLASTFETPATQPTAYSSATGLGDFLLSSWLGIGLYAPSSTQVGAIQNGSPIAGIQWLPIQSQSPGTVTSASAASSIESFAYSSALQGFSKSTNEIIVFGGSKCRDILKPIRSGVINRCPSDEGSASGTDPASASRSSIRVNALGTNGPRSSVSFAPATVPALSSPSSTVGSDPPIDAAMSSARGILEGGTPLLVAWGGVKANPAQANTAADGHIRYATVSTSGLRTITWTRGTVGTSSTPPVSAGASLVFSHVTGKFYLFGGYTRDSGSPRALNETWELSVSSATSPYSFSWKRLDGPGGLTCAPDCVAPPARFFHGATEVNFNNNDVTSEYIPSACTPGAPCSFVIFMERGTSDGSTLLQDRWVFDPTANGGRGHWQQVDQFPARRSTAAVSLSYTNPFTGQKHRKILQFGGEFGLQSPGQGWGSGTFLPGTLGDTWLFDVDQKKWDRTKLLGLNLMNTPSTAEVFSGVASRIFRQSVTDPSSTRAGTDRTPQPNFERLSLFTPPPLAGHVMVVRENSASSLSGTTLSKKLTIPEVYLFGGRLKDGAFHTLNQVYKFCVGSTGEDYGTADGDGTCDHYDATANPNSLSPSSDPEGRWLFKNVRAIGSTLANTKGSFQGAGAYDSLRDRILLYGGLSGSGTQFVTETSGIGLLGSDGSILEYTPPTTTLGSWTTMALDAANGSDLRYDGSYASIPKCTGSAVPDGRYGHSMAYDRGRDRIIVIGGYTSAGALHIRDLQNTDGTSQSQNGPEIWTAKRDDTIPCYTWSKVEKFSIPSTTELAEAPSTGMAHAGAVYLQSRGYGTGYYTMLDHECGGQGPISSADESVSKQFAGGIDIDLDRTQLGDRENLLLSLTHFPLGTQNRRPDGAAFSSSETANFRVHLMRMQSPLETLASFLQPRNLATFDSTRYPRTVQTLSIIAPPTGGLRQDQLLLPISIDPKIDRVRIERVSGSSVLIELGMQRLGLPK